MSLIASTEHTLATADYFVDQGERGPDRNRVGQGTREYNCLAEQGHSGARHHDQATQEEPSGAKLYRHSSRCSKAPEHLKKPNQRDQKHAKHDSQEG